MMRVRLRQFHIKGREHLKIGLESRIIALKDLKSLFRKIPTQCFHMLPMLRGIQAVPETRNSLIIILNFPKKILRLPFSNPPSPLKPQDKSGCLFYIIVV